MEDALMYLTYFIAGFLSGGLYNHHFGKRGKPDGEMGRNAGSVLQPGGPRGKGNPGDGQKTLYHAGVPLLSSL